MTQESINKPIRTDFNDLHVQGGIDLVRGQILAAIGAARAAAVPPAPLSPAHSQINGSGSKNDQNLDVLSIGPIEQTAPDPLAGDGLAVEGEKGAGENVIPFHNPEFSLDKCLSRFLLIEGKTDVWDSLAKQVIKKSAFIAMVNKQVFKEWSQHPKRGLIDRASIAKADDAQNAAMSADMVARYVYLEGTEEAYDVQDGVRRPLKVIKHAHPNEYDFWYKSPDRKMIKRENLVFDPTSLELKEGQINLFKGLEITPLFEDSGAMYSQANAWTECKAIVALAMHLCNGVKAEFEWLMKWIAYPLQHPGAKMASSVLAHGNIHGAGKSLFFGGVLSKIYGLYHVTLDQRDLESQYNDWAEQRLYLLFEEITNNKTKHNMVGFIKHLVTGNTLSIHRKFLASVSQANHMNTTFLSNHSQPLPLEEKDRRFFVLYPRKELEGELYSRVIGEVESPAAIRAFYTYLMRIDLSEFTPHTKPLMTQAKRDLIEYTKAGYDTFYTDWMKGETKYPYHSCLSMQLYKAFCQWARTTGEHQISMKRFIGEGKKYGIAPSADQKHWKGARRKGQNMMIVIGECPPDKTEMHWLGLQIDEFEDRLSGDGDVPNVI